MVKWTPLNKTSANRQVRQTRVVRGAHRQEAEGAGVMRKKWCGMRGRWSNSANCKLLVANTNTVKSGKKKSGVVPHFTALGSIAGPGVSSWKKKTSTPFNSLPFILFFICILFHGFDYFRVTTDDCLLTTALLCLNSPHQSSGEVSIANKKENKAS